MRRLQDAGALEVHCAIIVTWVFNHTRGSLLMAMLVHASLNTFQGYANRLFPAVADSLVGPTIGLTILAILVVIFTGGRLGYAAYRRDQKRITADHR